MEGAHKKEDKKEKKILKEEKTECPECGTENELEARFCEECGYKFYDVGKCSKCGASVLQNADICESCGEWLLEGQCKFCYSPLEEGTKFCAECGNPAAGIKCPQCHSISYFDFCKFCDIPLTKQALQTIETLKNSQEIRELIKAIEQQEKTAAHSPEKIELEKMRKYQQKFEQPKVKRKTFVLFSKEEMTKLDTKMQQIQEEKKSQQEKATTPIIDVLEKIQQKTFTNNQEARRFYGALKVLLPTITKKKIRVRGWVCNVWNWFHSPQQCNAVLYGGRWVFEEVEKEEIEIKEVEI